MSVAINRVSAWRWPPESRPTFGVETRVQTKVQALEQLNVLIFLGLGDAPTKGRDAGRDAWRGPGSRRFACRQRYRAWGPGNTRPRYLARCDSLRREMSVPSSSITPESSGYTPAHHVEQRGLAGAVAADHGYKVAVIQGEVDAGERALLGDGAPC